MLILTVRTDKPEAEIGLFDGGQELAYETWQAHRQLAETFHSKIATKLQSIGKDWNDIRGVVVYKGPGSFTGLRIGITVANTLGYSLKVPIIGSSGGQWIADGLAKIENGKNDSQVLPDYGPEAHITVPKK